MSKTRHLTNLSGIECTRHGLFFIFWGDGGDLKKNSFLIFVQFDIYYHSYSILQACQIETDPSLISSYIIFLSAQSQDQTLHQLDDVVLVRCVIHLQGMKM